LGADNYQYSAGSYMPVNVSRGFAGHGLASGPYYTDAQVQAFQAEEAKEMTRHVDAMNEDRSDEEEMEELSRDVRVKFAPRSTSLAEEKTSAESELYDLRKALAASSGGSSKKKSPPSPNLWFGMVGKQGIRWITSNSSEAYDTISKMHCRIEEIFLTRADAEAWMEKEESTPTPRTRHDQDSDNGSSAPEIDEKVSAKAKRRRKKNQVRKARRRKEKKVSKAKGKQTPRKADVRRPSRKGRHKSDDESDPSDSSDESSDDSSQSDSSSSSSSDNSSSNSASSSNDSSARRSDHRRSKKMSKKASKKHDKNRKKGKETNYHRFQHEDTSTGDSQRIYGMSINGMTIDKAVAPDSMQRIDRGAMYTAAVDVTSLPGGWNSNKGVSEEMFQESQKIAQLTSTILASTSSKIKGMEVQDTSWNSTTRHSLGRVKNREELFEFVKKLGKSKKAAFKQETNLIQQFMYHRRYGGTFIREYTRSSLLCLISARSFRNFYDLGNAIRQLAFDHANWESGPAKAMLSFHSEKLMEIRQFAVSRKQLILQVYTYLRDAQAKDFYHESMAGAIWERIANIPTTPASTAGGGSESSRCSYCTNKDMHKLFNVLGQRDLCPVKSLPNKAKAKDAAKWIVDQKRADSSKDIQTLLASALTQFV
jgi:hypothetical protein